MLRDELVARAGGDPPDDLRGGTALLALTRRDLRVALHLAESTALTAWPVATAELHLCRLPAGDGRPFAVVGPAVGAPVAAIVLELLAVLGAARVVAVGACGSLQPDLSIGATILPTAAIREEGTSHHYLPPSAAVGPAADVLEALAAAAMAEDLAPRRGPVWTTDALFRETASKVRRYQAAGVLGVDMETATLFAVGPLVGLAVAALLVVSDELGDLVWRPGFRAVAFRAAHERAVRAALAVCAR
jgi:uridine phosphorylase